jgi:nucleolar protein 58
LKSFQKFDSAATAVEEATAIVEGKVTSRLASLLDEIKDEKKVSLAVADPKLGMFSTDSTRMSSEPHANLLIFR